LTAKIPNPEGINPKINGRIQEANKLIIVLTINLIPVFLNIAQNEVIRYQFHNNKMELAIKNIKTFLK
jgi:hypothetical protein